MCNLQKVNLKVLVDIFGKLTFCILILNYNDEQNTRVTIKRIIEIANWA